VGVAETINHGNPVVAKNLSRIASRLVSDEQDGSVRCLAGISDELPRRGGVGATLELDRDLGLGSGESDDRVDTTMTARGLGIDSDSRDAAQDAHSVPVEGFGFIYG
jgi:hypothetical protein